MPLFIMHMRGTRNAITDEARNYPDLAAAMADANHRVRSLLRSRRGRPAEARGCLEIVDEERRPLARVLFADVAHTLG